MRNKVKFLCIIFRKHKYLYACLILPTDNKVCLAGKMQNFVINFVCLIQSFQQCAVERFSRSNKSDFSRSSRALKTILSIIGSVCFFKVTVYGFYFYLLTFYDRKRSKMETRGNFQFSVASNALVDHSQTHKRSQAEKFRMCY